MAVTKGRENGANANKKNGYKGIEVGWKEKRPQDKRRE